MDKIAAELVKIARELVGRRFRKVDERLVKDIVFDTIEYEVTVRGEFGMHADISGSYTPATHWDPPDYPDVEFDLDGNWVKKPYAEPSVFSFKKFMLTVAKEYARKGGMPENMDVAQFAEMDLLRKAVANVLKRGVPTNGYFEWEVTDGNMYGSSEVAMDDLDGEVMVYGKISGNAIKWIPKVKSLQTVSEKINEEALNAPEYEGPDA